MMKTYKNRHYMIRYLNRKYAGTYHMSIQKILAYSTPRIFGPYYLYPGFRRKKRFWSYKHKVKKVKKDVVYIRHPFRSC